MAHRVRTCAQQNMLALALALAHTHTHTHTHTKTHTNTHTHTHTHAHAGKTGGMYLAPFQAGTPDAGLDAFTYTTHTYTHTHKQVHIHACTHRQDGWCVRTPLQAGTHDAGFAGPGFSRVPTLDLGGKVLA